MALDSYSDLQTSLLNWLGREGDTSISAVVADGVRLVESKLNRVLRVGPMEATTTLTGTDGVFALPDDFSAVRRVSDASYGPLQEVDPNWAGEQFPTNPPGPPQFYTIAGANLTTYPATSSTVDLDYYQKIPALSDSNPSNWLLVAAPDIYLFMGLIELNAFAKNPEAAALWNDRAAAAVDELRQADTLARYSRAVTRPRGATP